MPVVLNSIMAAILMLTSPLFAVVAGRYADSLPDDGSEVCGITTEDSGLLLVFVGDGANAVCQAKANPELIGPSGWSVVPDDALGDLVAAQDSPQCTFHLLVAPPAAPVQTRVYASTAGSLADAICTGLTQFFPSVEATQ